MQFNEEKFQALLYCHKNLNDMQTGYTDLGEVVIPEPKSVYNLGIDTNNDASFQVHIVIFVIKYRLLAG